MNKSFVTLLDELEINKGDLIFLHVSYSRLQEYVHSPTELIDSVLDRIGETGTLFMPRYAWHLLNKERPWKGYALYLQYLPTMDLRYTEANIGLVPEVFRSEYEVEMSISHFWPIAAKGRQAREILTGQQNVQHAFGSESSFSKLVDANTKILGLGVTLNTSSLAAVVDYRVGNPIFTEPLAAEVIDMSGTLHLTRTSTMLPEAVREYCPSNVMVGNFQPGIDFPYFNIDGSLFFSYKMHDYLISAQKLWAGLGSNKSHCPWIKNS